MGLMTSLNLAVSGLRSTQAGMDVVAANVANSGSVGYSRRTSTTIESVVGGRSSGVRTGEVQRVLDQTALKQLRLETAGAAYTALQASFSDALGRLFGPPGGEASLDGTVNAFSESLQRLVANPGDTSVRNAVLEEAGVLASRVASISTGVQSLRTEAEGRIAAAVNRANELLQGIEDSTASIMKFGRTPALLDERDRMITELSGLVGVRTMEAENGALTLTTTGGATLFSGTAAARLEFDNRGILGPHNLYAAPPAASGVGTITAVSASGGRIDLLSAGAIRSGEIAAAVELRDGTLVEAQRQLDELAAGLALGMSGNPVAGRPAAAGGANGFDLDLTNAAAGDVIAFAYRGADGRHRQASILVQVGGAPPLPASSNPDEPIFALDLGAGNDVAAGVAGLQAQLGAGFQASAVGAAPATTLRILQDAARTTQVQTLGYTPVTRTVQGAVSLPLFVDGPPPSSRPYTGVVPSGSQLTGFAQRITVNQAVVDDKSLLVKHAPTTLAGDPARPQALLDGLTKAQRTFTAATGVGGMNQPYAGTAADFARRVVETRGAQSELASRMHEGQQVALATIETRFAESAAVNIDQEMAQLVQLQTAYGANARVMTAVRDMLDMLMRI